MALAIGTVEGGPIKIGKDEFLADGDGRRITARLDVDALRNLKSEAGVALTIATRDDSRRQMDRPPRANPPRAKRNGQRRALERRRLVADAPYRDAQRALVPSRLDDPLG